MAGWFDHVQLGPPIEVFALTQSFNDDTHPTKVNLGVGAYRTDDSKPWVLPVIKNAKAQLEADGTLVHEYLPVAGLVDFRAAACQLMLGSDCRAIVENRVDGIQSLGGTGALRIGLDFLHTCLGCDTVYVSKPTWENHKGIAKSVGFTNIVEHRYWDNQKRCLDIKGMLADLRNAPPKAVVLLHMVAHNPTGIDATPEQWDMIAEVVRERQLFPFFDCAYQGFASGCLEADAASLRRFVSSGFELFAAQSFSKNFGLYNERVGNLIMVCKDKDRLAAVRSHMTLIVRHTWSNPPAYGCRLINTVLRNPALLAGWKDNVKTMAERIKLMRRQLYEKLRALGTPGTWEHVITQAGMFSYTGLNPRQVDHLVRNYHIYLLKSGRINMCGLTSSNLDYVAKAIDDAVRNVKDDPKL